MSDLGIYFPEEKEFLEKVWRFKLKEELAYFGVGMVAGALLVVRLVKKGKTRTSIKRQFSVQSKKWERYPISAQK